MRFWMTMLDHELKASEYDNGIISGLAVLGLDTQNGGWMPAENFTPSLSAIVTVARAMVVYTAYRHRFDTIQRLTASGLSSRDAEAEAPSQFEVVKQIVQKCMTLTDFGGMPSPMDRMLHMRTYGMKIRMTTKGDARVSWVGDRVSIDKISFTLGDLRAVVHGLNESMRQKLIKDLMLIKGNGEGDVKMPELDLQSIFDNAAEMAEEWNFLKDPRNEWEVDGKRWIWDRMFTEHEVQTKFIKGGLEHTTDRGQIRWNEKGVEDYFRQVRRFKEGLFVLVHMTAGAPARGTEVISIRHENGQLSRAQRGIFIDRGMVQFVTSYHKGYSASQKVKIIHRYVPKEVGELVVYYIWLIEPFVSILQSMVRGQKEFSAHLWEPEPEEQWGDSEVGENGDEEEDDDENENDENDENSHGTRGFEDEVDESDIEQQTDGEGEEEEQHDEDGSRVDVRKKDKCAKNVDGFWDTDRVRRVITKETQDRIGVRITTAIWRQVYPAIQREWTKEKGVGETLMSIYNPSRDNGTNNTAERRDMVAEQAGHTRRMEEMIYGILLSESPFYTMSEREAFRKVSMDWHRFLHFQSAWDDASTDSDVKRRIQVEQERCEFERWKKVRQTDLQMQLNMIVGSTAQFRGLQKPGLEAIMARCPRVLIIMRTGGGKSLFFMLPARSSREGVSIVIVPLNSLREDLKQRCDKAGISCAEWDGKKPSYWASIMLVTPESAVTKAFSRFIDEKLMMRQLNRIVVDECHVVLDSTAEWRPQVRPVSYTHLTLPTKRIV